MSDSYFIGALPRIHRATRFGLHAQSSNQFLRSLAEWETAENNSNGGATRGKDLDGKGSPNTPAEQAKGQVGMMVSLDHTIYFHRPTEVKSDDWIFSEMEVPWSGEGRGLVTQRMWNKSGRLLASCVQEVSHSTQMNLCLLMKSRVWLVCSLKMLKSKASCEDAK